MSKFVPTDAIQAFNHHRQRITPILNSDCLPVGVRCVEYHSSAVDLSNFHSLPFEEQRLVDSAVDRRKADFGDSRWCSQQAMRPLTEDQPILRGTRGMPIFPDTVVGSMTHTRGYRAAIVGRSSRWSSLGIDAEPIEPLPEGVFNSISRSEERLRLRSLRQRLPAQHPAGAALGLLLFSAKESTYKSWFPLTGQFLDFDEADIDIRADGTFASRILCANSPLPTINGRWMVGGGFVITLTAVSS